MRLKRGSLIKGPKDSYEIVALIAGSIAQVYLGRGRENGDPVAVKIPAESSEINLRERARLRLERQLYVLRKVRHRNIVSLIDNLTLFEQDESIPCIIEEYVRGGRMFETFLDKPISAEKAFSILLPLIDAVSNLHSEGIIHRDLNPRNIIMETNGRGPVIIDFNISRLVDEKCNRAGTVFFSAPEQLDRSFSVPSASFKSDLYSLACIYVFLVTGVEPSAYFRKPDLRRVNQQLINLGLSMGDADEICLCLTFDPAERLTSLARFRTIVERCIKEQQPARSWRVMVEVDGRKITIKRKAEIGREHAACPSCHGKEMIYVIDHVPYIEKHHIRIHVAQDKVLLTVLPCKNKVALCKNGDKAYREMRTLTDIPLENGDKIALAYNEMKGPYKEVRVIGDQ